MYGPKRKISYETLSHESRRPHVGDARGGSLLSRERFRWEGQPEGTGAFAGTAGRDISEDLLGGEGGKAETQGGVPPRQPPTAKSCGGNRDIEGWGSSGSSTSEVY